MHPVRVGVIGIGGMGSVHCHNLQKMPDTELTAICDIDLGAKKAAENAFAVRGYDKATQLLESGLVELVIIATPHYSHPPIAIEAFNRGIHVISEKPIAVTVSAADEMIAAARLSGLVFAAMYQMRAEPVNQAARQIIAEGRIGDLIRTRAMAAWYRTQAYYDSGGWRATWAGEGGGVLINQAPHQIDLLTWLTELPSAITAQTRTRIHDIEVEDEAFAMLEYPNGAHGYFYASTTESPEETSVEVYGQKGKLLLSNGQLRLWEFERPVTECASASPGMWDQVPMREIQVPLANLQEGAPRGHAAIVQNVVRAIRKEEPLIAPGEEGLNTIEMINGMILSGRRNKRVCVPVDRAEYDGLIAELQRGSKTKSNVSEQRVSDPNFARH